MSSSSVTLSAGRPAGRPPGAWMVGAPATGRVGGRHCMAGQYGYVPLGQHLILTAMQHTEGKAASLMSYDVDGL